MRESKEARAALVLEVLRGLYPASGPHLRHSSPWELLVATMLSAQCTDARVNQVTPELFRRLPGPAAFAAAPLEELEGLIHSTGFFRIKAKRLKAAAEKILRSFRGEVPADMGGLLSLDGVARKTANVVLSGAFGLNEGLAVDTHVARIARRLELSAGAGPDEVERDLLPLFPRAEWGNVNHRLVSFGRDICPARSPRCLEGAPPCPMSAFCPKRGVAKRGLKDAR